MIRSDERETSATQIVLFILICFQPVVEIYERSTNPIDGNSIPKSSTSWPRFDKQSAKFASKVMLFTAGLMYAVTLDNVAIRKLGLLTLFATFGYSVNAIPDTTIFTFPFGNQKLQVATEKDRIYVSQGSLAIICGCTPRWVRELVKNKIPKEQVT